MKRVLFAIILLFALPCLALGANYTVSPTGSGSKNGSNWENCMDWSTMSFVRGNTYYLVDGTYAGKLLDTATSGSTYITIRKATTANYTDVTDTTGWVSTMGDGQVVFSTEVSYSTIMRFKSDYWIIDGVSGGGYGSWTSGHGIKFDSPTADGLVAIELSMSAGGPSDRVDVNYVTLSHIEMDGSPNGDYGNAAINATASGASFSYITIDHCYIHDWSAQPIYFINIDNLTFNQNYLLANNESEDTFHGQSFQLQNSTNMVFANNLVGNVAGTSYIGFYEGGTSNTHDGNDIYGNVFFRESGWTGATGGNGIIGTIANPICKNLRIYNNSFINLEAVYPINIATTSNHDNVLVKNNLFYLITNFDGFGGVASLDYNWFEYGVTPSAPTDSHIQNGTNGFNPVPNWASISFALVSNTDAGVNLGSPYNIDAAVITRTTWSRGAYEYDSGGGGSTQTTSGITIQGVQIQ